MHTCSQLFRRGAVYYYRRQVRWSDGRKYRIALSLLTRRLEVARSRAAHLSSAADFLQRGLDRADPPLAFAQRCEIFRRRLLAERDHLEALHHEIVRSVPHDVDPETQVETVFNGVERFSRAVVSGGMPNAALTEKLAAEGLILNSQTIALWDAEVDSAIAQFALKDGTAMRQAMLKIIHEARIAGIAEFRQRLLSPASGYVLALTNQPSTIDQPRGSSRPEKNADNPLPAYQPALPERGVPVRGRAGAARRRTEPPADQPSADWARVTVLQAGQRFIAGQPKAGGGAAPKLKKARHTWDPKTLRQFESAVMLLDKACPGPIWQLSQSDLDHFAALLDRLPARSHHKTARHEAMSLEEIASEAEAMVAAGTLSAEAIGLMPQTTNRHFRFLRALCEWVKKRVPQMPELDWSDFIIDEASDSREQRDAFTADQARTLFQLPTWTGFDNLARRNRSGERIVHDAAYWLPLLAHYTGGRRNELAKLMLADIDVEDVIPYLRIDATETGRVKTPRSKRLIPIADELIRLGFLGYVVAMQRDGQRLLFPDLVPGSPGQTMGDVYYKRFWRALARQLAFLKPGQAMHAFRHLVSTELKDAEVFEENRSDLLGHAGPNAMADRYSKASALLKLQKVVNKIPIVTAHLQPAPLTLCKDHWIRATPPSPVSPTDKDMTGRCRRSMPNAPVTPAQRATSGKRRESGNLSRLNRPASPTG
ncbi:tyrosine-type recombinase/integrase [Novosphingobium lindaniclasticum]|uniref:Tyr recombinase domain-containing protein n=1 Tax=Novosphingobium lindaniclasticum LE124 TaxID=1096930 RepID=T0HHD0_9SPHN|nr:tyrosine-type recombinase/integrase [Novosphingobium lindaniclasticum]EQB11558.1 hypothetical protein L284_16460 [Novosphingobium lindaniclasticum LE124]